MATRATKHLSETALIDKALMRCAHQSSRKQIGSNPRPCSYERSTAPLEIPPMAVCMAVWKMLFKKSRNELIDPLIPSRGGLSFRVLSIGGKIFWEFQ
jgi:hypothetical protein